MAADSTQDPPDPWRDALTAAQVLAVGAPGVGGIVLRAGHGPVRDEWLAKLAAWAAPGSVLRRIPAQVAEERLMGGLDFAATLARGEPHLQTGLLAQAHQGFLIVSMAERLERGIAACIAQTLDSGEVRVERDGFSLRQPAAVSIILCDESAAPEEAIAGMLGERLALWIDLRAVSVRDLARASPDPSCVEQARRAVRTVRANDEAATVLCAAAVALGIDSLRAPLMALSVARVLAALAGRGEVGEAQLRTAARLVLAPRAVHNPAAPEFEERSATEPAAAEAAEPAPQPESADGGAEENAPPPGELRERVIAAATAALPADLLARCAAALAASRRSAGGGRAGTPHAAGRRGRPAGVVRGVPRAGLRLSVIDTLRAAAPWQRLRRLQTPAGTTRMLLRAEDFHIRRYQERSETVTIFVVDASGSSALHRLAEAKGAVELLLAQCYVRRDRVAVIAFRNRSAEVLLPPTRSLVRARRSMAGLAGGGGTPLAAAIQAARQLAAGARRAGLSPTLVFLTDGRANLTLAGIGNRRVAEQEALSAARLLKGEPWRSILIDTSPRPAEAGKALTQALGGVYLPLPYADPARMAQAVQRISAAA